MVGGAVAQLHAAQAPFLDALQPGVQLGAVRLGAGALEAFHQDLGAHKTLHHGGGEVGNVLGPCQVHRLLDDGVVERALRREHLRDHHAPGLVAQQFHEAARCVVGKRDDLSVDARCPQRLDAVHHRRPGANEDHGLRLLLRHPGRDRAVVGLGAVKLLDKKRVQLVGLEAGLRAREAIGAKGVVHMHHANALDAQGVEVGDGLFHLALVGRAHVEDELVHRLVEHHGAGGGPHQRHAVLLEQRHDALRVRRAACHEQADHALFFNQRLGVLQRELGVELVVQRNHLDLLAAYATLGIDMVDVEGRALHGFGHRGGGRAGDAHRLADQDLCVGRTDAQGGSQGAERAGQASCLHGVVSCIWSARVV